MRAGCASCTGRRLPAAPQQALAFLARAHRDFADNGIVIERLLTDSGPGYKSRAWAALCAELGITHTRIRAYRPQTNGKVERFNRTLADEMRLCPVKP